MFKVYYHGSVYTVYAVDKGSTPLFLIYSGGWSWVSADYCSPAN